VRIQIVSRVVNEMENGHGVVLNGRSGWKGSISPATGKKREYVQTRIGKELTGAEFEHAMTRGPKAMPPDLSRNTPARHPCVPGCQ
jgi:hypothetical protein